MALAHHYSLGSMAGSTMAIVAPSGGPLKTASLQGKRPRVRGSAPFGGRNGLVCLFLAQKKYCHNGGMASAASWRADATAVS
jgi:hypothetical protein